MPVVGCILFAVYGLAQIIAAYNGIEFYWGFWASVLVMGASLMFRFSLPVTVFSFLGALNVWGWPWYGALIFAAPGLVLVIPAVLAQIAETSKKAVGR